MEFGPSMNLNNGVPMVPLEIDISPTVQFPNYTSSNPTLLKLVNKMLHKGAIYEAPHQRCFQSRIFSVPKPDGSDRLILDLSILNKYISVSIFKMTNHIDFEKSSLQNHGKES